VLGLAARKAEGKKHTATQQREPIEMPQHLLLRIIPRMFWPREMVSKSMSVDISPARSSARYDYVLKSLDSPALGGANPPNAC
jgi:hypothetical protein